MTPDHGNGTPGGAEPHPRARTTVAVCLLAAALLAARWILPEYPLFVLSLALVNIVAVLGVNLVMGYAGQISLGHAGFAAIGAYGTALLQIHVGFPFWAGLAIGGVAAGITGYLLAFPALRLSPLYVAMVTFGFGQCVMLIAQNWVDVTRGPNGLAVPPATVFGRDLMPIDFHLAIVAFVVVVFWIARNLVESRMGRAFIAIRESELAALSMGIDLTRYKTVAFAIGAAFAGISGALYAGLSQFINPDAFVFPVSIMYVTMGILGGMGSLAGPALGGTILTVLPEILRGSQEYKEFLTGLLLLMLLVFLPRGILGVVAAHRGRGPVPQARPAASAADHHPGPRPTPGDALPLLELQHMSVRFGGLRALQGVDLQVWPREIVGLIGPNGAGKTTLFNATTGLVEAEEGMIRLEGKELQALPAHARTGRGLSRTFQNVELFRGMSVLDNVLVGMHARLPARWLGAAFRTPAERREERESIREARRLLDEVGLADGGGLTAESLAFGHQRLLEIARALASHPRVLFLDEPAAGLSAGEVSQLLSLIGRIREERDVAIVLVAHTMRLVMGASDRVVVLDHGEKIAEGTPAEVRQDRNVIAAYLGQEASFPPPACTGRALLRTGRVLPPDALGNPMLEVAGLQAAYGQVRALHDVSLTVAPGETVCLLGANGAGKTTTLRCIANLHRLAAGTVRFEGRPIHRLAPDRLVRLGIAMVPERRDLFPELSLADNLHLGAYTRRDRQGIAEDLARVHNLFPWLQERAAQEAGTLSGGEQQMVAIGRALMARPRLLLLDEPTLGLAPNLVSLIFETIARIRTHGVAMLLVEQNTHLALRLADRGYVLETGRIVLAGSGKDLLADSRVQESYLGGV